MVGGKWLRLEEVSYRSEDGQERKWERVSRTTSKGEKSCGVDGVAIRTVLRNRKGGKEDAFVFVRQYRPAVQRQGNGYLIFSGRA